MVCLMEKMTENQKRKRLERERKQVSSSGVVQRTTPEDGRKQREKINRQMTH